MRVLDVAAGNGNAAVEAARAGAGEVVASDIAPLQVEQGRERTAAEGIEVEWVEADAEELPFDEASFDAALSVFGAMFAPRPERVAAELFRVVRPGGTVAMANWRPEGFQGGFFKIMNKFRPPPEGVKPSALWGLEEHVEERFAPYADEIRVERRPLAWSFESLQQMGEFFANSGPGATASELSQEQQHEMGTELFALVNEHNTAEGGAVAIESYYSVVVARKKS
jgi:ubiquinone/menaquinone biosynthesis C-methylase UbiE